MWRGAGEGRKSGRNTARVRAMRKLGSPVCTGERQIVGSDKKGKLTTEAKRKVFKASCAGGRGKIVTPAVRKLFHVHHFAAPSSYQVFFFCFFFFLCPAELGVYF